MMDEYEEFTESQLQRLEYFVTNTTKNIFCLRNLPEVIKGALFSRYSRSSLGLRALLLREFIANQEETSFESIVGEAGKEGVVEDQLLAIKKAQNFYDRVLDGYGDDSIGELGGAHLAIERISILAAKVIEDCRVGGSPLEKSTRYIYFDQKVQGEYLFYREPILMASAYRDLYLDTCNRLFDTYGQLIPELTTLMEKHFPKEQEVSKVAYSAALRAKVLDCLRGLLPAATLTNMGVYGNGRFFETLIHKLHCHDLAEMREIGKQSHEELAKIIPSFIRRGEVSHRHHQSFLEFYQGMNAELELLTKKHTQFPDRTIDPGVRLLSYDSDAVVKVVAALLFPKGNKGLEETLSYVKKLPGEEIARIIEAACDTRENRRHKSPRALENASFTFEILADFGVYRDLQRHRILTQERQQLSCDYGFYTPLEIVDTPLETAYCEAMHRAKEAYDIIASELPEEAQYVVPMAYNVRWYFHVNLRALQWLCELRSAPQGHPTYRYIAQFMAKEICRVLPAFEPFFQFVDFEGYEMGRLEQEQRKIEKQLEK